MVELGLTERTCHVKFPIKYDRNDVSSKIAELLIQLKQLERTYKCIAFVYISLCKKFI